MFFGSAREFFDYAREASRDAERIGRQLAEMEVRAEGIGSGGFEPRVRSTPDPDRMAGRVVANADHKERLEARREEDYRIIDQAMAETGTLHLRDRKITQLSGGEAQRVKLATELSRRSTGKTIYILDEPTTGLHFEDIRILMEVIQKLVDRGNSVIIIEHNLDVIKLADHIIDMGLEGGKNGGTVLITGTPEEVAKSGIGYTSTFIKQELNL